MENRSRADSAAPSWNALGSLWQNRRELHLAHANQERPHRAVDAQEAT